MSLPGLFITGTDTDVGKTFVTCLISRALQENGFRVGVYKPVCSGAQKTESGTLFWPDIQHLSQSVNDEFPEEWICPQRFIAPFSPPQAALMEQREVDSGQLRSGAARWEGEVDVLLTEGVGGLLCPLTTKEIVASFAADLGFPLLIVVKPDLGTINHTLMTVEIAKARGLKIAGIVMNSTSLLVDERAAIRSCEEITAHCGIPILGIIPHFDEQNRELAGSIGDQPVSGINWTSFIEKTVLGKMEF
jgi:dethiobiotin synthetase